MVKKNVVIPVKTTKHKTDIPADRLKETVFSVVIKPLKIKRVNEKSDLTSGITFSTLSLQSTDANIFEHFPNDAILEIEFKISQKTLEDFEEKTGTEEKEENEENKDEAEKEDD